MLFLLLLLSWKKLPTTLKTIVESNADTHTQYIYFQTRIKIILHGSDISRRDKIHQIAINGMNTLLNPGKGLVSHLVFTKVWYCHHVLRLNRRMGFHISIAIICFGWHAMSIQRNIGVKYWTQSKNMSRNISEAMVHWFWNTSVNWNETIWTCHLQ